MSTERPEVMVNTGTPIRSAQTEAEQEVQRSERIISEIDADVRGSVPQYADSVVKPELTRAEKKARLVQVLERGIVHDRLAVSLPPDVHGEWVRDDPLEIARMQTLGFVIDYVYAPNRSLHSDGSDVARVADVIFMTCPKEVKELIDEIRNDQFLRINAPSKSKEDTELIANTLRDTQHEVPAFTESQTHTADRDQIAAALAQVDAQTQPAGA